MHKSLPNTTRQAGKRYCQNDKVRITQRQEHTDHVSNVQGKVLCSFGFVHHPWLRAVLLGDQTVITDYACDCYEYNDNSDFAATAPPWPCGPLAKASWYTSRRPAFPAAQTPLLSRGRRLTA